MWSVNLRLMDDRACRESQLAVRAQGGCGASFEALVRAYQVPVLAFLMRRGASRADAEDLVQETFLRAYRSLHRFDPRQRFAAWLFTIAHRLALNHWRDRRPGEGGDATATLASSRPSPHDEVAAADAGDRLWDHARAVLTPERFTMLWLRVAEDLSPGEIAAVVGRSGVSVRVELHRARRQLQQSLAASRRIDMENDHARPACT